MYTFNCEYCGAIIDYSKDKDVCPHCGSSYIDTTAYHNQIHQDAKIRVMLAIDGVDEKQEQEIKGERKTPTRFILCDSCGEKIILGKDDRCPHCGTDYQNDKEFLQYKRKNTDAQIVQQYDDFEESLKIALKKATRDASPGWFLLKNFIIPGLAMGLIVLICYLVN